MVPGCVMRMNHFTGMNQGVWVRHFIDNIVDIQDATDDQNIHPIIVDFGSRDSDTDTYLKGSRLKHCSGKSGLEVLQNKDFL